MAFRFTGTILARYLSKRVHTGALVATTRSTALRHAIRPGDVLLVEGNTRFSVAVKYLTQSTWSHAALYVGDLPEHGRPDGEPFSLVEADVNEGVCAVPLSKYENYHTRICRPVGLSADEISRVTGFAVARIGHQYDLRNVFDLARYLIQRPPVPNAWRRRLLAFGSGDPTRAICSSLIAEAFQSIRYPILPDVTRVFESGYYGEPAYREILHIRHHSLYTPRDFDISPYFEVVKPELQEDFDFHKVTWAEREEVPAGTIERATPTRTPG